jgi:hypothetical protein
MNTSSLLLSYAINFFWVSLVTLRGEKEKLREKSPEDIKRELKLYGKNKIAMLFPF